MLLGVITAHYGVEGDGFYGIPLSQWLPYSVARTWHVQIGLFWIATAWLAAGLFIGPLVSEQEPEGTTPGRQRSVLARIARDCRRLADGRVAQRSQLSVATPFRSTWGHQGYEYVDLGRIWQIGLLVGLLLWLFLMVRALLAGITPTRRAKATRRATRRRLHGAIALFYGAGLTWGRHTNLSIVEYWRWWVVHLWVEGFFEVFATTVIAFCLYATESDTARHRRGGGLAFRNDLSRGRHHRHLSSPVFFGNSPSRPGVGLRL
ncbi:MAG: cbb3-type cytochrome c oxidase subunit I [Verrucomicrobiota bacterium]